MTVIATCIVAEYGLRREYKSVLVLYMLWNLVGLVYTIYRNIRSFRYDTDLYVEVTQPEAQVLERRTIRINLTIISASFILVRLFFITFMIFESFYYYGKSMRQKSI